MSLLASVLNATLPRDTCTLGSVMLRETEHSGGHVYCGTSEIEI